MVGRKLYKAEWYQTNKERQAKRFKEYYLAHRDEIKEYYKKWRLTHKDAQSEAGREYHLRLKMRVLNHYSGGTAKCSHCKETDPLVLCVDHINGGGNKQRRQVGGNFNRWLIRKNFPLGYQVLCANCNLRKRILNKEDIRARNAKDGENL